MANEQNSPLEALGLTPGAPVEDESPGLTKSQRRRRRRRRLRRHAGRGSFLQTTPQGVQFSQAQQFQPTQMQAPNLPMFQQAMQGGGMAQIWPWLQQSLGMPQQPQAGPVTPGK